MKNKIIFRNNNFIIELIELNIHKTYKDVICGLPTKEINKSIISSNLKVATRFCDSNNIIFLQPKQTEIILKSKYKNGKPFRLPYFTYFANLTSYGSSKDLLDFSENKYYNEFSLLWFFDSFSIKIPKEVIDLVINKLEVRK